MRKVASIYLTEESPATFKRALRHAGLEKHQQLYIMPWNEARNRMLPWEQLMLCTGEKAQQVGAQLIVIDTTHRFAELQGDKENSAGQVLQVVMPPLLRLRGRD